jgi:hypothetical protein
VLVEQTGQSYLAEANADGTRSARCGRCITYRIDFGPRAELDHLAHSLAPGLQG